MQAIRSTEKLSSGMRVNRSADDAAGLTVSEKMRNQMRGLDQATRNVQDGISLLQVMDGGLSKIHEILSRQRELTVQALNGVYTMMDRLNIQIEIDQLSEEITAFAYNTEFNGIKPLFSKTWTEKETVTQSLFLNPFFSMGHEMGQTQSSVLINDFLIDAGEKRDLFYFDLTMNQDAQIGSSAFAASFEALFDASNMLHTDLVVLAPNGQEFRATVSNFGELRYFIPGLGSVRYAGQYENFAVRVGPWIMDDFDLWTVMDTHTRNTYNGRWVFSIDNRRNNESVSINSQINSFGLVTQGNGHLVASVGLIEQQEVEVTRKFGSSHLEIQSGANRGQRTLINLFDASAENLNVHNLNILSLQQANSALLQIDNAVNTISGYRAKSGSQQNRLEHTLNNLRVAHENTSASNSRIRDTDIAQEILRTTKLNIKQQSAILMLAQANASFERTLAII